MGWRVIMLDAATPATQLDEYVERYENPCAMRLRGHGIGLEQIVARFRLGFSVERMRQDFPELRFEQIYGAITYYLHHRAGVDAYVAGIEAQAPITPPGMITADEKITAVIRAHSHEWEEV